MISEKKKILFFGDKDTDGISSISILALFFKNIHKGDLLIRNSTVGDDYGLCESVVKQILTLAPDLLVTLDFGTSNFDEINFLSSKGIEVIVIDHHEIPKKIPNCKLINPKREDSIYPEKKICTAALATKLILGYLLIEQFQKDNLSDGNLFSDFNKLYSSQSIPNYLKRFPQIKTEFQSYLSLAAIGTITDMMPLKGENRILVSEGLTSLMQLNSNDTNLFFGLKSLLTSLNLNPKKIVSKDLGWMIGPILNAAGRMGQTEIATKLLLSNSKEEAIINTKKITDLNLERRERTKRNLYRVEEYFKRKKERVERKIIFCYEPDLEPGVSGIVATKLVETYKRPTIFINPENGHGKGSIRSYKSENVLEFLEKVSHLLIHFGGHKEAGGFSIELKNIPKLEEILDSVADEWLDKPVEIIEEKSLISFKASELGEDIFKQLEVFQPFGLENLEPLLSIEDAKIINYKPLNDRKHAKFSILGVSPKIKFVIWNKAEDLESLLSKVSTIQIFGYLEENYFKEKTSIQFVVTKFHA